MGDGPETDHHKTMGQEQHGRLHNVREGKPSRARWGGAQVIRKIFLEVVTPKLKPETE